MDILINKPARHYQNLHKKANGWSSGFNTIRICYVLKKVKGHFNKPARHYQNVL